MTACSVPGCDATDAVITAGLCGPHRARVTRYGDTFPTIPLGSIVPTPTAPTAPTLFDEETPE